jgi:Ni/Co efflux regulator RcnB
MTERKLKPILRTALALALMTAPLASALQPQPAQAQARRTMPQRGDYLPAEVLKAGPNVDAASAHLRRPPSGYGWFSLGGVYVLASVQTGLIVEVVAP